MTLAYAYETGRLIHPSRHFSPPFHLSGEVVYIREYTIQYTAAQRTAQRSVLQHITAHYNDVTHYNIVQHIQHTATIRGTHCKTHQHAVQRLARVPAAGLAAFSIPRCSVKPPCIALQCVAVCCSVSQGVAGCCRVLQGVAVCCSVLQCVAGCSSAAVCTRVLQ